MSRDIRRRDDSAFAAYRPARAIPGAKTEFYDAYDMQNQLGEGNFSKGLCAAV